MATENINEKAVTAKVRKGVRIASATPVHRRTAAAKAV